MPAALDADVVMIGAGVAGLVAARELRAGGASGLVLEARERVGGRLLNGDIGGGDVVELGGQWIGPGRDRVPFAGTETASRWAGFIDGAVSSGERTAAAVLASL